MLLFPTLKTFHHYYSYVPYHFLLYSTLHYSTLQYFKFILENDGPLFLPSFIPAVLGQVPELLTVSIQLPLPSF